jgi:hypothetical protein
MFYSKLNFISAYWQLWKNFLIPTFINHKTDKNIENNLNMDLSVFEKLIFIYDIKILDFGELSGNQ